jgi:flavin reductase ActVB
MSRHPTDRGTFRDSLSRWASGVSVVTTQHDGERWGFTATSFTGLSMDPPLVLVCLDLGSRCRAAFDASAGFAVHLLEAGQQQVAQRFAAKRIDKFHGLVTQAGLFGVPLLEGALARLECRTTDRVVAGDHVILVGEVLQARLTDGDPLIFHDRAFRDLRRLEVAAA